MGPNGRFRSIMDMPLKGIKDSSKFLRKNYYKRITLNLTYSLLWLPFRDEKPSHALLPPSNGHLPDPAISKIMN
jgi:hypothetical protein